MGVKDEDLTRFSQFLGLDNKTEETSAASNTLREAVNLDLTDQGKLRTRRGYTAPLVATTLGHSLWADEMAPFGLYVDEDRMSALFPDESTQQVTDGLAAGMPVSYQLINDMIYWSNGAQRGAIALDLTALDWACPNPTGQPTVSGQAAGALTPGTIQITITFVDARGRESGSALPVVFESAGGGLLLTDIPQPTDPNVTAIRIYTSKPNGAVLYRHAQVAVGTTSYVLLGTSDGPQLATFNLQAMPAGHIVRLLSGRMLVAAGRFLFWSEPLRYGLFNPAENYVALPERIAIAEPVGSGADGAGVYVVSGERTYWFGGRDPKEWGPRIVYPYGAVPGTTVTASAEVWGIEGIKDPVPAWLSRNGLFCVGLPGGQISTFNAGTYSAPTGQHGASMIRDQGGLVQMLVAQTGAGRASRFGITDTATARTYHHDGTVS